LPIFDNGCFEKNGKLRTCVDFKKLNTVTKKDPYPLPFIDEVINTISRHDVYTFLDGFLGYHQVLIAPKDQHKIVFIID